MNKPKKLKNGYYLCLVIDEIEDEDRDRYITTREGRNLPVRVLSRWEYETLDKINIDYNELLEYYSILRIKVVSEIKE